MYEFSQLGLNIVPLASTVIAGDLISGQTFHSFFKLPVPLDETSASSLTNEMLDWNLIRRVDLIIIDEVSMIIKYAFGCIDYICKKIMGSDEPFGGKRILIGGDFRQTANVVLKGKRKDVFD